MLIPSTSYVEFWKFPFESLDQDARFQQKKELKIVARVPLFGAHGAGAGMEAQEKKGLNNLPFEVRLKGMQQAIEQYQREIRIFKKFVLNSKK